MEAADVSTVSGFVHSIRPLQHFKLRCNAIPGQYRFLLPVLVLWLHSWMSQESRTVLVTHPPQWIERFLESVSDTGSIAAACRMLGIDESTPHVYADRNSDFAERLKTALAASRQSLNHWSRHFLEAWSRTGNFHDACGAAEVNYSLVNEYRKSDPEFREAYLRAAELAAENAVYGLTERAPRPWEKTFLTALAVSGNIGIACQAAGISRRTVGCAREKWGDFREAFTDAWLTSIDLLKAEARRRAYEGVDEPVIHHGKLSGTWMGSDGRPIRAGEPIPEDALFVPLTVKKYDNQLLMFLLKALCPEEFRENYNVPHANIDDEIVAELKRLRRHPARVPELAAPEKDGLPGNAPEGQDGGGTLCSGQEPGGDQG